jgi:hypothetical protein
MHRTKFLYMLPMLILVPLRGLAQRTLEYDQVVVPQNRIDARDLGYPPVDVIPDGSSAITSLSVAPRGKIYGATSGKQSFLFVLNPRHGYVQPLGQIPHTTSVTNSVVVAEDGDVYIGAAPLGHLLRYVPTDEDARPIRIRAALPVTDLGEAVPGESITALTIDRENQAIYGLTSPNAHLFAYAISTQKFLDLGVVASKVPFGEKFETAKIFSRMLAIDQHGVVYASGEDGFLYRGLNGRLEKLAVQLPAIPGREPWTRADCFLPDGNGLIYGGTSDGYLFRFNPASLTIQNLGKPLLDYEITGLGLAPDGKIYGVGGDDQDMVRLFSYDPQEGSYDILGFVDVNRRPYYTWQAYVIKAVATGLDGTIYLGESERVSKLYLYYPVVRDRGEERRKP